MAKSKSDKTSTIPRSMMKTVDQYLDLHLQISELEAKIKPLKAIIKEYVSREEITQIDGSRGGRLKVVTQNNRSYDPEVIKAECDKSVQDQCLITVVDKKKFEAFVTIGAVDPGVASKALSLIPVDQLRVSSHNMVIKKTSENII